MKLFSKKKKGFTIVELVIVVAVIAVLSAILIPTFVGLVNKSHIAADDSLVRDLNNALAIDREVNGEHKTMSEALKITDEYGFNVQRINAKANKSEILWDSENDVFCYFDGQTEKITYIPEVKLKTPASQVKDYQYFVIKKGVASDADLSDKYSTYLYQSTATSLTTTKGLDVGEETSVTSVTYNGGTNVQNVVIRTNSAFTTLTVNASTDSVKHYGVLGNLILTDIAYDCFYEYGKTAYAEATKGKIVAKEGGTVQVLFATAAAVAAVEDGGTIGSAYCVSTNEAEALSTGYNNFSDSKSGNVEFKYVDSDMNPITAESVAVIASDSQDELKIEEIETSGLYEARIGTTGYATFIEATATISAGETLVLCKDIVRSESESVALWDKPFNVDLNGHTYETLSSVDVDLSNMGYKASAFCFAYDGNYQVTVKNGTIKTKYGAPVYAASNTVVLENVTLFQDHEHYHQTTAEYSSGVRTTGGSAIFNSGTFEGYYVMAVSNTGGNYTVNGGTFTGPLFFSTGGTTANKVIIINGGTFNNFSVINGNKGILTIYGGTFDADPSLYVAEGYVATESNGVWTVAAN